MLTAREEAKQRLKFFKHIIEDCDGYKNLYVKGVQIAQENDLQRLFRFVWYGTTYKVDAESNNGRGQTDFIRPLAKLSKAVKVADASNQGKTEGKALSSVTVTFREDTKPFEKTDGVFNKDTFS